MIAGRCLSHIAKSGLLLWLAGTMAFAQQRDNRDPELDCNQQWSGDRGVWHCDMRELTVAASGARIVVDEVRNGGVSVKGWNRNDIWVRARVRARADTENEARALAGQVRIETAGLRIRAEGPQRDGDQQWSVGFEIFVPHRSDLSLAARNGGIHVSDVHGDIDFETRNGGVSLERLAGDVSGHTRNGGVSIDLAPLHPHIARNRRFAEHSVTLLVCVKSKTVEESSFQPVEHCTSVDR